MTSISPTPTSSHHRLTFSNQRHTKLRSKRPSYLSPTNRLFPSQYSHSLSRVSDSSTICRCSSNSSNNNSNSDNSLSFQWRWDTAIQEVVKSAIKRFDSYMNSSKKEADGDGTSGESEKVEEDEWDWDRWGKHFVEIDEQERLVSVLKSQLGHAVSREDYADAARLKVAIAAAATNDIVGRVLSNLNRAVVEERYQDAAFLRDKAGAGLVGWWSGISDDVYDPYGLIIHITAEHGRYVARSYSPRQLSTAATGVPLFEVFVTRNKKGEYKQQAVYLQKNGLHQDSSTMSSKAPGAISRLNSMGPTEDKIDLLVTDEKSDLLVVSTEETDDGDDTEDSSDLAAGLPGFQNILRDMIPGVKVKVLKVTAPAKVDKDFIAKVIEQIMDDEDEEKDVNEEKDIELESVEAEIRDESDEERDSTERDADLGVIDNEEQSEIAVKVVVGGLAQIFSGNVPAKDSVRVPAKLEKKGRRSFFFSVEEDSSRQDSGAKRLGSADRMAKLQNQRSVDHVMFDFAKSIGREKMPLKVLKDLTELINLTLSQTQSRQPLTGSTTFQRIEIPASPDPLNGLYIGAHGLYSSEVIHLQRKFGQWQDDHGTKEPSTLEFYEYVEAVKLTGDPYVPAGQVAFRAKVGKRYQLPHKGIIPEEFGVIARYKGQGKLAEPGFRKPRWVDGELVILDGKYIKGGPVVGFVYWAPEYHFLVFFNRLRLQ